VLPPPHVTASPSRDGYPTLQIERTAMNSPIRLRCPSAATMLAVVALVLACTGSAFAGSVLISGKQIKDSSVTGTDIHRASIHRSDLANDATDVPVITREAHTFGAGPVTVTCHSGEHATGGGGNSPQMWKSQPHADANGQTDGWTVQGRMPSPEPNGAAPGDGPVASSDQVTVAYVLCAS
jgi:hypothetical protein